MANKGRLHNTVRNMSWHMAYQVLVMTLGVILPKYIISVYGSEINGLTSTIRHALTLVTIVQAGLGTSATYLMYKPLEENDRIRIASLLQSIKKMYRLIAFSVAGIGLVASVILMFTVKGSIGSKYIFIASFITCIDSSLSLYFTAACNLFLNAKQDKYIISIVTMVTGVLNYAIQVVILLLKPSFLFLYFNNLFICVVNILILLFVFRKQYEPYKPTPEELKEVKTVPIPGVTYAALNEASHSSVGGMITVAVSIMGGLKAASVLSVYMMVINLLSTVSSVAHSSFVPSYGSMVAEKNMEKTNRVFEIFQFSFYTLNTFLFMCTTILIIPFVKLYTADVTDVNYFNELLMVLCIVYGMFFAFRIPYNNTVSVTGLFKETCKQPIISAGIAIILMFVLTRINYSLVLVGPVTFYMTNTFYQHFALKKLFPGFENGHFWRHFAVAVSAIMIALCLYRAVPIVVTSFFGWILYAIGTVIVCGVILLGLLITIDRSSFLLSYNFFKEKFLSKIFKKR